VLAAGAWALPGRGLGATALGLVFALQGVSLARYHFDPAFGREDWRGAVAWVQARERSGDVIWFDHAYVQLPFDHYYRGPARERGVPTAAAARQAALARVTLRPGQQLFLVVSHCWDRGDATRQALARRLCPRDARVFRRSNGIEVYRFVACGKSRLRE
jgi:hypothetical protein